MTVNELKENDIQTINKKLIESLENYRKTIAFMACDAPLELLGLPKVTQTILLNAGCLLIYDLFDRDFTEIKGLGAARIRDLTTRLNEFLAMR